MKKHITSKQATQDIQIQINKIEKLSNQHIGSADHVEWRMTTQNILLDIFGQNSPICKQFIRVNWNGGGRKFITDFFDYEQKVAQIKQESYISGLEQVRGILKAAINKIHREGIENVFEPHLDSEYSDNIVKILSIIENQLRKTIRYAPCKRKRNSRQYRKSFFRCRPRSRIF